MKKLVVQRMKQKKESESRKNDLYGHLEMATKILESRCNHYTTSTKSLGIYIN